MRFSFVGDLSFNTKEDAKVPAVRDIGDSGIGINATVISSKNNRAYVEAIGWKNSDIKTKDVDGNDISIDWDDRKDKDVIKKVASYKKNVISLGKDDRYEFITSYDFCDYIAKHIDELNEKRFLVTGNTEENFYNGKESKRFQISNLYLIDEDDERKNKLEINPTVIYFTKDSIDAADFKTDKKIYINGYTREFVSKRDLGTDKGESRYIPQQFILDCSKIDFDNEKQVKQMNFNLMMLGLKYENNKISNKLKSGKYYSNEARIIYSNGAQDMGDAEDITYDMLTDLQKMKIDLGLAELSDFASKGHVYGPRVIEFKITSFPIEGDYSDGLVILEDTVDEFEDLIYVPSVQDKDTDSDDEDEDEFMPKPKSKKKEEEDDEPPFDTEEKPTKKKSSEGSKKKKEEPVEEKPEEDDNDEDDEWEDLFG